MGYRELRRDLPIEEFDYQLLITYLNEYSNKREKITNLLKNQKIIRVKKGLYVFGSDYRKGLICKETLANQIYGPSYISFEYALSLYGMIPERVEVVTSATVGTNKKFISPIGTFLYRHLPQSKYATGFTLRKLDDYHFILIATPEKALIDQIYFSKGLSGQNDLRDYLLEDLRIDEASLKSLSLSSLNEIANIFSSAQITSAVKFIKELHTYE